MINWQHLTETLRYYTERDYTEEAVPWVVAPRITAAACDKTLRGTWRTGYGDLIASAEQGFLARLDWGLKPGRYCALTPCFREEEQWSATVRPYFMKVELISVGEERVRETVDAAKHWFRILSGMPVRERETSEGIDLEINGIEVGSYGYRQYKHHRYTYGTGLAEPRFSVAVRNVAR